MLRGVLIVCVVAAAETHRVGEVMAVPMAAMGTIMAPGDHQSVSSERQGDTGGEDSEYGQAQLSGESGILYDLCGDEPVSIDV